MALIECKYCGAQISDKATNCPKCGKPVSNGESEQSAPVEVEQNRRGNKLLYAIIGVLIVALGGLICLYVGEKQNNKQLVDENLKYYKGENLTDSVTNPEYDEDEAERLAIIKENEAIYNAYWAKIKENNEKYSGCEYFLWEIDDDKDGVPELWTVVGDCSANYKTLVYAYKNGKLKQIYEGGGNCAFYGCGGYVIQTFGSMGHAYWIKLTFDGGEIHSEKVFEQDTDQEYKKPDEHPIELTPSDDDTTLIGEFCVE